MISRKAAAIRSQKVALGKESISGTTGGAGGEVSDGEAGGVAAESGPGAGSGEAAESGNGPDSATGPEPAEKPDVELGPGVIGANAAPGIIGANGPGAGDGGAFSGSSRRNPPKAAVTAIPNPQTLVTAKTSRPTTQN